MWDWLLRAHARYRTPMSPQHTSPAASSRAVAGFGTATSSINRDSTALPCQRHEWRVSPGANPPDVALQTRPPVLVV